MARYYFNPEDSDAVTFETLNDVKLAMPDRLKQVYDFMDIMDSLIYECPVHIQFVQYGYIQLSYSADGNLVPSGTSPKNGTTYTFDATGTLCRVEQFKYNKKSPLFDA